MKRITYISRHARDLSAREIARLERLAERRNRRAGITGVLLCFDRLFFQIIEGDGEAIDALYAKIQADSRHKDILCLKTESEVGERQFPEWSLKLIKLDEQDGLLTRPVQVLFQVLAESYDILATYTHASVGQLVTRGINPLEAESRRGEKAILFCDMNGFSLISARLPNEEVMELVNEYFTICTRAITARGGEVTKFMGDCVMAQFARDRADGAIEAALAILSSIQAQRERARPGNPLRAVFCGIGLAFGEVIEGNVGTSDKMEYAVLGEPVNQAAHLEKFTRRLDRSLLFSSGLREILSPRWKVVALGEHALKARQKPVAVYSIDSPLTLKPADAREILKRIARALGGRPVA